MSKFPRHQARQVALQILYRYDVEPSPGTEPGHAMQLAGELTRHFEHFDVPQELREFSGELVSGTLRERPELDRLLEELASHWKVSRMGLVDRNLLRMAIYELSHFPDTPSAVVIDEAVELAKQYGTADSPAFVNGILDSVRARLAQGAKISAPV